MATDYTKLLEEIYNRKTIVPEYKSQYGDRINALLNQYSTTQPFSYDPNKDKDAQAAKQQYQRQGRLAMEDTIGTAAGLTGGYGNSYATAAGAQAYNSYMQDFASLLPSYKAAAQDEHERGLSKLLNEISMYQSLDDADYSKFTTERSAKLAAEQADAENKLGYASLLQQQQAAEADAQTERTQGATGGASSSDILKILKDNGVLAKIDEWGGSLASPDKGTISKHSDWYGKVTGIIDAYAGDDPALAHKILTYAGITGEEADDYYNWLNLRYSKYDGIPYKGSPLRAPGQRGNTI